MHKLPDMKLLALAIAALSVSAPAWAEAPMDVAHLEIVPGWETPQGTYMAGIKITLADGWKTYWRAPGDAGIPPLFQWIGSENIASASFHWPTPEVFDTNGMRTIGYHDSVVIPVEFQSLDDGPMRIKGRVDIGVCDNICVPVALDFDSTVLQSGGPNPMIAGALIDQPMTADRADVTDVHCDFEIKGDTIEMTARIDLPPVGANEWIIVEAPQAWVSESDTTRNGDTLSAKVDIVPMVAGFALDRSAIRLTVLSDQRAVDIRGCAG